MTEALQLLRESFSATRSAHQEQWYGITTEAHEIRTYHPNRRGVRILKPALRIAWRNYQTGEDGELAIVEASRAVEVLSELFEELQRLRHLRRLKVAA